MYEQALKRLASSSHIVTTIPPLPNGGGDPVLKLYGNDIADVAKNIKWAAYLSSTGRLGYVCVYAHIIYLCRICISYKIHI